MKYLDDRYNNVREKIKNLIEIHNGNRDVVMFMGTDPDKLEMKLEMLCDMEKICVNSIEWQELAKIEIDAHEKYLKGLESNGGVIINDNELNEFEVPTDSKSNWQVFKKNILEKKLKFNSEIIKNIEKDVHQINRNISNELVNGSAVKGLVIGGVQSGKTTNMASLMAMSSDNKFNLYIILSGINENLRVQTEIRLKELIDGTSKKRDWELVPRPENSQGKRLANYYKNNKNLYLVVLKNKTRLEQLINWITADISLMNSLRVIVIDDEADQASVNTSKDTEINRKAINRLIGNLVSGLDKDGNKLAESYGAMNYIGYTATPYANILSEEPNEQSLYPKNFISVLSKGNQHFGPSEIFGSLNQDSDGLDIVRNINFESGQDKMFIDLKTNMLPDDLKESLAYYFCAATSLRMHNFGKPISMLIHLSNKIDIHNHVHDSLVKWVSENQNEVLEIAERVWTSEIKRVRIDEISKVVAVNLEKTLKPHSFQEIEKELIKIISNIGPSTLNENDTINYHEGLITVLEHSGVTNLEEDEVQRLIYPDSKVDLEKSPIFLIIGGATLSRGLTLEGLITSYFLRTPSAADTLTQMGRWFGYRINYENYPRVWMTGNTREQFRFISDIEEELYAEIRDMVVKGTKFSEVGPKITSSPYYIDITSRVKRYAMDMVEYNFTGFNTQTYKFDKDEELQKNNVKLTENFINVLGKPNIIENKNASSIYWNDVSFNTIKNGLLLDFNFMSRISALGNIPELIEWIDNKTKEGLLENWNIILGGIGKANQEGNTWVLDKVSTNMVNRTQKDTIFKNEIDIGTLRAPKDMYGDLDFEKIQDESVLKILNNEKLYSKKENYQYIRETLKLEKVPQLIIYKIDKDSTPREYSQEDIASGKPIRKKLDIGTDLIGLYIIIPAGDRNKDYNSKITVKMKKKEESLLDEADYIE